MSNVHDDDDVWVIFDEKDPEEHETLKHYIDKQKSRDDSMNEEEVKGAVDGLGDERSTSSLPKREITDVEKEATLAQQSYESADNNAEDNKYEEFSEATPMPHEVIAEEKIDVENNQTEQKAITTSRRRMTVTKEDAFKEEVAKLETMSNERDVHMSAEDAIKTIKKGDSYAEVGAVPRTGLTTLERLRAKRSFLLFTYVVGAVLVVLLVMIALRSSKDRETRVSPTKQYILKSNAADLYPGSLRMTAEYLATRMNTYSYEEIHHVIESITPYLDTTTRDAVLADYNRIKHQLRFGKFMRLAFPINTSYMGSENDVHTIWVLYDLLEANTEQSAEKSKVHRRVKRVAILDFIAGVPQEGNLRGIYLVKLREYSREEWLDNGGKDIWKQVQWQADQDYNK